MSRKQFIAAHPHPLLWIYLDVDDDSSIEFMTGVAPVEDLDTPDPAPSDLVPEPEGDLIVPVTKAGDNPFADRVMVGRSRNCDVVIRRDSISKLHAVFRNATADSAVLIDRKSMNGTFVNGTLVTPGEEQPVRSGDEIQFGDVTARFLDAGALYDLLE